MEYDQWEIEGYYFREPQTLDPDQYYYKVSSPGALPGDELSDEETSPSQVWQGGIFVGNTPTPTPSDTPTYTPTPWAIWKVLDGSPTPRMAAKIDSDGRLFVDGEVVQWADMENLPAGLLWRTLDGSENKMAAIYYNSTSGDYDLALEGQLRQNAETTEVPTAYWKGKANGLPVAVLGKGGIYDGDLVLAGVLQAGELAPTPTTVNTPSAVIQTTEYNLACWNANACDIDIHSVGDAFYVLIFEATEGGEYIIHRGIGAIPDWIPIAPALTRNNEINGYHFEEPDTLPEGQYYYKVSSPGSGQDYLTDIGSEHDWQGGILLVTPTPTKTPTPTFGAIPTAVWQIAGSGYTLRDPGYDIDRIAEGQPFYICWGPALRSGLDFNVEIQVVPTQTYVPIGTLLPDSYVQEIQNGPEESSSYYRMWTGGNPSYPALDPGEYHFRIRDAGGQNPVDDEETTPMKTWQGGVEVVTPCNTSTPTPTPTRFNLLQNPRFGMRYLDPDLTPSSQAIPTPNVAVYWSEFIWPDTGSAPPTGSAAGLGASIDDVTWIRNTSDVPTGGGCWSQEISSDTAFCGGVYQQFRVHPGWEYLVQGRSKIAQGNDNSAIGIGVALDGSTAPNNTEFWEWDKKSTATDPGNWGKKNAVGDSTIGSDWISVDYLTGTFTAVADTATVFLFCQSSGGDSTFLFNDIRITVNDNDPPPTPTAAPRNLGPLLVLEENGNPVVAIGARGDLVSNGTGVTAQATMPADTSNLPWVILESGSPNEGAWLDSNNNYCTTGDDVGLFPQVGDDRLVTLRGDRGQIVFAVGDQTAGGDVYCRGTYNNAQSGTGYDADNDQLSNVDEVVEFGTDPSSWDTDGDKVSDHSEVAGITIDSVYLPLPVWGSNPLHKDLWMEIDWMETPTPGFTPSPTPPQIEPKAGALPTLAAMFERAPLHNPDGVDGVELHVDAGEDHSVAFAGTTESANPAEYGGGTVLPFRDMGSWGNQLKDFTARDDLFRYGKIIFKYSEQVGGGTGIGAQLFAVTPQVTAFGDASIIGHEYGHCLGLRHGGRDDRIGKPNYNSIMNYRFTAAGVDVDGDASGDFTLDYSRGDRIFMDENAIIERFGVCGTEYEGIDFNLDGCIASNPIRWILVYGDEPNTDYSEEPVSIDVYEDNNDWVMIFDEYDPGLGPGHPE